MKLKSTIYKLAVILLFTQSSITNTIANPNAYCSPTFTNGCNLWNNQSISLGTINWTLGSTLCTVSDYTSLTTTLNTGVAYPVTVTNGSWCGCAVWIDFNNDQVFDSTENLYYEYANISSQYTYNFFITIPSNVNSGTYRMRLVAGWGTDCYNVSANGYGPCGTYEYGNFDDFTVNVVNSPVGIADASNNSIPTITAFPNPASSLLTVTLKNFEGRESSLQLLDITGKIIRSIPVQHEKELIDINDLPKGIYILKYVDGNKSQSIRIVK